MKFYMLFFGNVMAAKVNEAFNHCKPIEDADAQPVWEVMYDAKPVSFLFYAQSSGPAIGNLLPVPVNNSD